MAVQQLTQPIVNPISAFDAKRAHNITFTVIGGAQVVANRLVISNNETGAIVYNKTAITMKLEHTIPANTLTNGGYYNAVVYTIDNANNESVASTAVPFYCYSQPVLTIDNIPATETIENGTYTFTGTYIQQEGEILNSYQYTLYDSNKNVLSKTPLIYYETDSSLSYTFVGMSNDTSYYIELSGETVNGTHITSGVIYFTVRYIQPASFAICDLVNNCDDGYIQVSSNIVAIDGKSNPDPPIYIDDKEVDLRDPDSWVEWDSGFRIQDDFTLRAWGRGFNPYEPIITLKNDIDTPQTPNKIEMKWMTGDVIKNLPLYTSKNGNNINITDSEAANTQNLTVGGNSVEDKDNITQFIIDGNSEQKTREGYNLLDFNVTQDRRVTVNQDGTITINGQGGFTLAFKQFTAKANTKYYIKWELVSGTVDTSKSYDNSFLNPLDSKNIKQGEFQESVVENDKDISGFWINNMAVFTNAVIKFWANTNKSDFEQYGASPSPDYPSKIEVIDGYNLFDKNNKTHTILNADGSATIVQDKFYSTDFISIDSNATYYKTFTGSIRVKFYDKNKTVISTSSMSDIANFNTEQIFTIPYVNAQYIRFSFDVNYQDTIMIVKSAAPQPYLPYGNIGLKQTGKNIFDGEFELGMYNGVTGAKSPNSNYIRCKNFIPVEELTNYKFSTDSNAFSVVYVYEYKGDFSYNLTSNKGFALTGYLTTNKDTKYITFRLANKFTDTTIKVQIEEGTIATAYEPYHEKIIPIDLQGNTLAKVGDVKDLLKIYRNGDVEIEKNCNNYTFNESITILKSNDFSNSFFFHIDDSKNIYEGDTKVYVLCNYYINTYRNNILQYDYSIALSTSKNIIIHDKDCNTVEEMKNKLKSLLNFKIIYATGSPQIITLPSISPIELWQGTNIFTPITNLDTTMTTNYGYISVGDIKNIINVQDFNITYNQAYYQDTNTNFKLQPNYLYTLSFDYNINSESTDLYFSIGYGVDSYETNIASSIQYKTQNKGRNTISFIVPEEVSENDTLWVRFAQTIILANVNVDISNVQLEYGKKVTDYQTPGLYNIYLTSAAKNLYNYETPFYIQRNNVSYTEIQGGYEITPVIVDTPASLNIGWKSLLNPGDTYTVSYSQLGQFEDFKLYKTDKNSQKIISEIPLDNNTFVAPDGFYDLQLAFSVDSSSTTNHIDIWNIQIEASNVITTYDPYISNSSIITLEEPLRSSDEYRDLICLASPNLLNPTNQSAKVSGGKKYYLSQAGSVSYTLDFINEDNNKISSTVLTSGVFTTPDNCVKVQIENVEATNLTNNKVQINIGETARVYYPYVTVPSLIRYCKEENGVISVLDTPIAYDLSANNQNALEVLTTYTPISNVFTNNTVLGQLYLDYVSGYSNQQTENAYVLLKCWNANKMPYVIHSNYIDIPSDYNKIFIWCRRKGNLFDLKIEDLGDYREHDKPIDIDKPVVELVVDNTGVTETEIPVTATSIDNVGLRTVRFSKDNGATWDEIVPVDGLSSVNSYTFTGLTPDTTYTIRAEAIDLSGNIGGISENATTLA